MSISITPAPQKTLIQRVGVWWPTILLVVLCALYAIYWNVMAGALERRAEAWRADAQAQGLEVGWDTLETTGFPFRLQAVLTNPRLAFVQDGTRYSWTAQGLQANAMPYRLDHVIVQALGLNVVERSGPGGTGIVKLLPQQALASILFEEGKPVRFDADILGLRAELGHGSTARAVSARRWQLHVREVPEAGADAHDVVTKAEDVRIDGLALPVGDSIALAEARGRLTATGVLTAPYDDAAAGGALAAWRAAGGSLVLDQSTLRWGEVETQASGTLALDAGFRPEGRLKAFVKGYRPLIDTLVVTGRVESDDAGTALAFLDALGTVGLDAEGKLPIAVTIENGRVRVGPADIGRVPPLVP